MKNDKLVKAKEVAERLNVNPRTVKSWLLKGKLKGYKVGGQWRVKESDLDSFFKPNI